jgi:hypothetical protein
VGSGLHERDERRGVHNRAGARAVAAAELTANVQFVPLACDRTTVAVEPENEIADGRLDLALRLGIDNPEPGLDTGSGQGFDRLAKKELVIHRIASF